MNTGIFIAGILVTLIVVVAMGVLVWGLRLEARANARERSTSSPESAHHDRLR